ncbi:MAG TPA: CHAD domain-containing protein [Candidatus Polarisedimenticolaceae bacterium]|nr:CHAD domain-containing protein [Candidatus Polarisedimenticolaceae bacterium]
MAETAQRLRLVPSEGDGDLRARATFAVPAIDDVERALGVLESAGRVAPRHLSSDEREERWLDTADRRIAAAVRLLRVESGGIARLSPLGTPHPVPADDEGSVQASSPVAPGEPARAEGEVGTRVAALAGQRLLETVATVRLQRRRGVVRDGDRRLLVELDELRAAQPGETDGRVAARLTIRGTDDASVASFAAALSETCALTPAPPFAATARDLAGVEPPGIDLGPTELPPRPSLAELAFATLRSDGRDFLAVEPAVRLGDDPEAVHDMRVAARRLRAALGLFEEALPARARALRRELRRFGAALGGVRDLEVQLTQLAAWRRDNPRSAAAAFDAIEGVLRVKHAAARRKLLRVLEAKRYGHLVVHLTSLLTDGPKRRPAAGRRAAVAEAPRLIRKRYRRLRRVGDPLSRRSAPAELHELRIACKRLRYALDFYQPLYDGAVAAMIDGVSGLQNLLGHHQDMWVAIGHLEALAQSSRRKLPPQALFLMGAISAQCERRASSLRRSFSRKYRKVGARRKRALKAALDDAAPKRATKSRPLP